MPPQIVARGNGSGIARPRGGMRSIRLPILPLVLAVVSTLAGCGGHTIDGGSSATDGHDCDTNAACIDRSGGAPAICQKTSHVCQPLLTSQCTRLLADVDSLRDDDVVVFGAPTLASTAPVLQAGENALELTRRDFHDALGGLPRAHGKPRPFVFVACDADAAHPDDDVRAIDAHLFGDLALPAAFGVPLADAAPLEAEAASAAGAVILGVTPVDAAMTPYVGPHGAYFAHALAANDRGRAFGAVATFQAGRLGTLITPAPTASPKAVLVTPGDGSAADAATAFLDAFRVNGAAISAGDFRRISLGTSSQSPTSSQLSAAAADIVAFDPDLVVCDGTSCADLVAGYEKARPGRSAYVVAEMTALPASVPAARVLGVRAGRPLSDPHAQAFAVELGAAFPETAGDASALQLAALESDVAHAIAFAAIAAGDTVTGSAMGAALRTRFVAGGGAVKGDDLAAAASALVAGQSIDYAGAWIDLHYGSDGAVVFPVSVVCYDASGKERDAGLTYDVTARSLDGTFASCP